MLKGQDTADASAGCESTARIACEVNGEVTVSSRNPPKWPLSGHRRNPLPSGSGRMSMDRNDHRLAAQRSTIILVRQLIFSCFFRLHF
jgi:hypothetical protein